MKLAINRSEVSFLTTLRLTLLKGLDPKILLNLSTFALHISKLLDFLQVTNS